ncbi:MAG: hypothetical protein AAF438_07485 [Pseudomonadota bacterium]
MNIKCLLLFVFSLFCYQASVADDEKLGHGSVSLTYQLISVDGFDGTGGEFPIGPVDTHTLNLEVEYTFKNRWTVSAGLPFVRKRYTGPAQDPHNPALHAPPGVESDFVDDGDYHSRFQDFHLGLTYHARYGSFRFDPYVNFGVPSNSYTFFGHAAVGQRLLRSSVGSGFTYLPPFSDFYLHTSIGYEFVEETLGVDISHWRLNGEFGYFVRPNLTTKLFFIGKRGGGLEFPNEINPGDPRWFQHDRLVQHNFHNVGVGVDWAVNEQYNVSLSFMTQTHSEQVHILDYAVNMGVSWGF